MSELVEILAPGDVVYTRDTRGYLQGWIVQRDGTFKPIISGAEQ